MARVEIPHLQPVDIDLPEEVRSLYDLAYNLWWTWDHEARHLFEAVDEESWRRYRNPVETLLSMDRRHWEGLIESDGFMARYRKVVRRFERYMNGRETWFDREHGAAHRGERRGGNGGNGRGPIAYFSMEYGIHQSLPIYSGGLGVLSGDHCKAASDLGLPFVAVGLLYSRGYFKQTIDADGFQQHTYLDNDFHRWPLRHARGPLGKPLVVEVPFPDRTVSALVWVADVGRVPVLFLDTDIRENHPADRPITSVLYVSGRDARLAQEVVLGIGGVKALATLGIEPGVWHINEGHSALLQLERISQGARDNGLAFEAGWSQILERTAFTTHTPVPAGNEKFDGELVRPFLELWSESLRTTPERLAELGRSDAEGEENQFNMTAVALRSSRFRNGVSQLNAEVANGMWSSVLEREQHSAPIEPVTNGVHVPTWLGPELRALFEERYGIDWLDERLDPDSWQRIRELPDAELWEAHAAQKARLARFTGGRLLRQYGRHGRSPAELRRVSTLLDPNVLTIGFARRFATYKRARLVFRDLERLRAILERAERPIQIVMAGKAHPADRPGQELIQKIFKLTQEGAIAGRVVFLESYDMRVARMLVQGVDVWLNTPRRPLEASGTSGQKAGLNGVLNFSILDGWWPEGFNGDNGWVIGGEGVSDDKEAQDEADAVSLYDVLENEIAPLYYEVDGDGVPAGWVTRMKSAIASVGPSFSAARMVRDYVERGYLPLWSD